MSCRLTVNYEWIMIPILLIKVRTKKKKKGKNIGEKRERTKKKLKRQENNKKKKLGKWERKRTKKGTMMSGYYLNWMLMAIRLMQLLVIFVPSFYYFIYDTAEWMFYVKKVHFWCPRRNLRASCCSSQSKEAWAAF